MNLWKYQLAKIVSSAQPTRDQIGRRVLMYHSVDQFNNKSRDVYSISNNNFAKHVELLANFQKNKTSHVVSLASQEPNGVSITFDDGYCDTLTVAAILLCSHNLPFSVFVTVQNIIAAESKYLSKSQLIDLSKMPGVTIGGHGYSHLHLADLSSEQVRQEFQQSKEWLEQLTGKAVDTMSYPHGSYTADVVKIAREVGFRFAATSNWGVYQVGSSPLEIPRIDIWSYDTEKEVEQKLTGKWDWMKRFI